MTEIQNNIHENFSKKEENEKWDLYLNSLAELKTIYGEYTNNIKLGLEMEEPTV
jgi:hypothetical protein